LQFDLDTLLSLAVDERRAWLEAHQPHDDQQTNWSLGLIQSATLGATLADSVQNRRSHEFESWSAESDDGAARRSAGPRIVGTYADGAT
jgi:hypothetical protein